MNTEILEFLFVGPLFSINKQLKGIRKEIMGLREDLQGYSERLDTAVGKIREDFAALDAKLASSPAKEDVSAEMAKLGESIGAVESLDRPDATESPGGAIIPPNVSPEPDETTAASPGEPTTPEDLQQSSGGETGGETPAPTPVGEEQPASNLPPETPTVPAEAVESGTVAPDTPVTPAGEVPPETPVVPVELPPETSESNESSNP
jgi:hypothetical protein